MYCTNCGQFNPDSASRCSACGAALEPLPSPGAPSAGTPGSKCFPVPAVCAAAGACAGSAAGL
jgi:hypothetical protein